MSNNHIKYSSTTVFNNNQLLRFLTATSAITASTIYDNGNIGIGISNPTANLHIRPFGGALVNPILIDDGVLTTYFKVTQAQTSVLCGLNIGRIGVGGSAQENSVLGLDALNLTTTGGKLVAIGPNTLRANTSGTDNVAAGYNGLRYNTTGSFNVGIGSYAGEQTTTGVRNVSIGPYALQNNTTGSYNVCVGLNAGTSIIGDYNVFIGTNAGLSLGASVNNTLIIDSYPGGRGSASQNLSTSLIVGNYDSFLTPSTSNQKLRFNAKVGIKVTGDTWLDIDGDFSTRALTTSIGGDQNNLSTDGRSFIRLNNTSLASKNITGLANGFDGKRLILTNVSASQNIVLMNQNVGSSAANRIITNPAGSDITLVVNDTIELIYDFQTTRWRVINR